MRVLHLIKTVDGAEWALRQIAVLQRQGIDVVVALPSSASGLAPSYARAGARVVEADLDFTVSDPWRLSAAIRRCRALVAEVRPDVIHSHFVSTTLVARLALGKTHPTPRVFQVPGPLHLEHPLFGWLDLVTSGPQDFWIGSCRWTEAEYARRGVSPDHVFLSYYGSDVTAFSGRGPGTLRREMRVDPEVPLVGMIAYFYAPKRFLGQRRGIKGHEDFIEAFRDVGHRWPTARAVVVGGPWAGSARYERRLQAQARKASGEAILFTGKRSDVPLVYADLDVAVHPSLSENCGGAVESLAAACPTVATDVGGLPDVVIDGETGWLVPPCDPARLAAAIGEALADPGEACRRARAGQQLVRRLFDVERTGREIATIYGRILDRDVAPGLDACERVAAATG
jgi:glycosyltransferase involved in cell wall biosynthesis